MVNQKIDSASTTDMTNNVANYEVPSVNDTGSALTYYTNWTKWISFYQQIPELQSEIDKKALWTVGKGYQAKGKSLKICKKMRGNGKESFNSIMYNSVKTYTIAGDYFAEIIKKNGTLFNLKTLNPGSMRVEIDKQGFIIKYHQFNTSNKKVHSWEPEDIFHLCWNKKGENPIGTSTIEKLTSDQANKPGIIEMYNEARQDLRLVFHRYVKPLIITHVDSDDENEISKLKAKLDKSVNLGENLIIPKDTVEMERMSIPQYSTLDPLPWLKNLQEEFIKSEGVPGVILGGSEDAAEATAKILYLAFQQMVEWNQLFLEEQCELQLGLEVEFNFPASIIDDLKTDETKDGNTQGFKKSELNPKKNNK